MDVQPRLNGITTPSPHTLQRLLDIKYGRAEETPREAIYAADTKALIELQQREGYEFISDGQHVWGDIFRPIYNGMEGVQMGSQTRWYETNGFCFPPKIVGAPNEGKPLITADYLHATATAEKNHKSTITLPGPYTLCRMTENTIGIEEREIMDAFTHQLARIVRSLPPTFKVIEFTEPSWGYDQRRGVDVNVRKRTIDLAFGAYSTLVVAATVQRKVLLQLPHANFIANPEVLELPVHGYGIDLTETVAFSEHINFRRKTLSAGVLDAWSSVPEDLDFAAQRVRQAIETWSPAQVFVTTNAQMFHSIPYAPAMERVKELAELAKRLQS